MLDHATSEIASGSKLGIDATKKIPGEGFKRAWPPLIKMDEAVKAKIDSLFSCDALKNSTCAKSRLGFTLWVMKLRFDLAENVTPEMVMKSVLANNHRYKAEPLFSNTGTGSLSSASTKDRANEETLSMAITRKLIRSPATLGNAPRPSPDAW